MGIKANFNDKTNSCEGLLHLFLMVTVVCICEDVLHMCMYIGNITQIVNWFICLKAYQPLLGYLMPKSDSLVNVRLQS